jgi:hypothetical protein
MVSGTCWYHYGWSWTEGHAEGWHLALARMQQEAIAVGANAIVDVKMRKIKLATGDSMDFTVLGTAVRVSGLEASRDPVVATVPALEFVRLLEAGIVPVGIAIGARYDFLYPGSSYSANLMQGGTWSFANAELPELGQFWENILRFALFELRNDAERQGGGVLAHTHFGQILKIEEGGDSPPRFLGRHIVIGTVVDSARFAGIPHEIRTVVDMWGNSRRCCRRRHTATMPIQSATKKGRYERDQGYPAACDRALARPAPRGSTRRHLHL